MSEKFQAYTIQNLIGYGFKDQTLLTTAFTHQSAVNKHGTSNQNLIFLGKAVCELLVRDYLYSNLMNAEISHPITVADAETKIASLTKKCFADLKLTDHMIIADHASALRFSQITKDELALAVSGAIYKDGGMPAVRAFVLPKLRAVLADENPRAMQDMKRNIKKNATEARTPFSDTSTTTEKKNSANPFKNLFSHKKRVAEPKAEVTQEKTQSPITEKKEIPAHETIITKKTNTVPNPPRSTNNDHEEKISPKTKNKKVLSPVQAAEQINGYKKEPTDGNYKSALQEYVQKNIRSSTVMLEYKDSKTRDGYTVQVYLFGKQIAESKASNKKDASQKAAQAAYTAINTDKTEASAWFKRLKSNPNQVQVDNSGDYVSQLNCAYQKKLHRSDTTLKYETSSSNSKQTMIVKITADGKLLGIGEGKTVKEAKQNAAKSALLKIN